MRPRGKTTLAALLLVAAALPAAAGAQVSAPRLVQEGEEPVEEPAPRPPEPLPAQAPPGGARPPAATGAEPAPAPADGGAAGVAAAQPPAPPPPAPAADLARRIVPVSTSWSRLMEHWAERRAALREADPARADAARAALLGARRELGIDDLVALSAAEIRDAGRALAANLPADAIAHAEVAVALSPDFADAHLALARARFAAAPGEPGRALAALGDTLAAAWRDPHARRAFLGDLFSAGFAAVFAAAAATILLLLLRTLRLFLHDFHHLPLLRGTASVQTGFLALVLLAIPVAFGLGPIVTLGVATLAAWLYLGWRERGVATAALLALVAMPWAAGEAARVTAWTGSVAERIHDLEHGGPSDAELADALAEGADAPAPLLAAIGRAQKRRGDLEGALRLYRAAAAADPRAPELLVNEGNVRFLQGDLEGAKSAYLAATDRAGGDLVVLGAAHYDLSKLYLRTSDMEKSAAAREKAEREAGPFLARAGSDDDFGANRYLVDVPVPDAKIAALAASDGTPEAVSVWLRTRLRGPLPGAAWPWAPLALVAALWLLALAAPRLAPARTCDRCGRPACRRCDGGAGPWCGQCVNVYEKKGVVDARDRLRKEAQVRRHAQFTRVATRILALVGGGAGHVWHGAAVPGALLLVGVLFTGFLVWFWRGIMPPPQPSPYVLAGKLAVALPVGLALWALAVRDAFRRTRS